MMLHPTDTPPPPYAPLFPPPLIPRPPPLITPSLPLPHNPPLSSPPLLYFTPRPPPPPPKDPPRPPHPPHHLKPFHKLRHDPKNPPTIIPRHFHRHSHLLISTRARRHPERSEGSKLIVYNRSEKLRQLAWPA